MKTSFKRSTWCLQIFVLLFCFNANAQEWVAKHGLSPTQYQAEFTNWTNKGYRLTSVTGYTNKGAEKYAAIWVKQAGPAMIARHGLSASAYQTAFNDFSKQGYRLASISGYAVNGAPKFAAIWDKANVGGWVAHHNMSAADYQANFDKYDKQGYNIAWVNGYVVNGKEMFAAIWNKSPGGAIVARHNMTGAQYQQEFNKLTGDGYTLKLVSGYEKNGSDLFAAIWQKTSSPLWASRHGIPGFNYQHAFDNMYYQGYRPVYINAYAGNGADNYNVIWQNQSMSASDLKKLNDAVANYMDEQDVQGMSLAVSKDGRLVYARGFGYADPATKEEMSPNHSMRIMSISKPVTSAGIMKLMNQGKLTMNSRVFGSNSILGSTYPTPSGKTNMNSITIRDLLYHNSGMRTCNGEAEFWDADKSHDACAKMLMASDNLMTTSPNMQNIYSNTGYFWLMMVIEKLSGQPYETFIRQHVLTPSGIGQTMYVGLASGGLKNGEAHYTPNSKPNMNNWAGFGGWVARPIDLLKFLNRFDGSATPADIINAATHDTMTVTSPLSGGYGKGWIVNGARQGHNGANGPSRSWLMEVGDGYSVAVIANTAPKDDPNGHSKMLNEITAAVKSVSGFPSYNLF